MIAYKKAHFTFIKFPDIQILLQDSQLYQYLSNKSFGTSGDVNLGCELTLVQKHVFLFFFYFFLNIDITSVLSKVQVSIDSDHETMLGHYQCLKTEKACTKLFC